MRETRYSEEPAADIWKKLLKYSFGSNIQKLTGITDENLLNVVSGSIVQASEYFNMAERASLNTSPLLMYYGCVNLLFGICIMKTKGLLLIKNHGATILNPEKTKSVGDTEIHLSGSEEGAFFTFNKILSEANTFPSSWKIRDVLGYIPDIKSDYEECYSGIASNCIPLETVKRRGDKLDRIRLVDMKGDFNSEQIVDFPKAYLNAQKTNEYIVLRDRLKSSEIGVYSVSGQKNLLRYTNHDGKKYYLNQIMAMFLGLYSLSVLSRYHPGRWFPFVQRDDTGEKGLVEDFLSVTSRKLPNLALNLILGKEIHFLYSAVGSIDLSKDYDPDEVKRIVHDELRTNRLGQ